MLDPSLPDGEIRSRRHLAPGRVEVIYGQTNGDSRIGRIFRTDAGSNELTALMQVMGSLHAGGVLVPDRVEDTGGSSLLLSLGFEGMKPYGGPARPFRDLLRPVLELHAAGWHHLDLSPHCFADDRGELRLLCWGDVLASGMPGEIQDAVIGAPPDPLADIRSLARASLRSRGLLWDGDLPESVTDLASGTRPRMLSALAAVLGGDAPYPALQGSVTRMPAFGRCTVIHGGSWESRDAIVSSWTLSMLETGTVVRFIRCRPDQSGRPLPDRFPFGAHRIDSVSALLDRLFPAIGDVRRMLVINDADAASADLAAMMTELSKYLPGDLALVVSAESLPGDLSPEREIALPGGMTRAEDRSLLEIAGSFPGGGAPFLSASGIGYRCTAGIAPSAGRDVDPGLLLAEGAYRFLIDRFRRSPREPLRRIAAESSLMLGMYREALELAPREDTLLRARSLLALGDPSGAAEVLRGSGEAGEAGTLLLAEAMSDGGDHEGAVELLTGLSGTASALLLSRVMDLQGRASEALPAIRNARRVAGRTELVPLLCSESNILMRMGDYPSALAAAETAAVTAGKLGDSSLLAMGLRERGRVREILGFWRDALGDYRLSRSCAGSDRTAGEAPSLVDQYVLELRTGDLRSARMTLHALRTGGLGRGAAGQQMLEMLAAYRGVLLGLGSRCIPAARRAVAMAAEQGLALRHALSLLYLGQLEEGSGAADEALEALNGARARAGLIGDRHLILLADLALAGAGALTGVDRLVVEADELGLRMEGLEARILAGGGQEVLDGTFEDLLDLPAPLKAIELAVIIPGGGPGPGIRERLRKVMLSLAEMLDGEEREAFEESHGILAGGSANAADEMLMTTVRTGLGALATWVKGFSTGVTGLRNLALELDLDSLSSEPTGAPGEVRISESPDLYATGRDLVSARLLGPIAAVLNGLQPAPAVEAPDCRDPFPEIIGRSVAMIELKDRMEKAAPMSVPVLVIGETGTGKELVSRGLHQMSGRSDGPFIAVDCGAIAPALLESELFGAAKGAYTDSRTDRKGLMETADGGTLFLDEIGNLTPVLQTKLLRVLETGKVRRLGDTREYSADFRLVCATNRDPSEDPGEGGIRPDLYYRIAVVVLRLPPLRERLEDIPLLAGHFAGLMVPDGTPAFSGSAMRKLGGHGWPGNIRELRNVVQRALIFRKGGAVTAGDISLGGARAPSLGKDLSIEECVAGHVARVVRQSGGNVSAAAAVLCCDPKTVRKYMALHGRNGSGTGPVSPGSRTP